jgi:ESCRT-II complex subunit VPS22
MTDFETALKEFALKHRSDINADPQLRAHFHELCKTIGVDPLASNKGFWAQLLGVGDFYFDLGVKVIEACVATRDTNGGLIAMDELLLVLNQARAAAASAQPSRAPRSKMDKKAQEISADDVARALDKVSCLGGGYAVVKTLDGRLLVQSVPGELSQDQNSVLSVVAKLPLPAISEWDLMQSTGWGMDRVKQAIRQMMQEGLAMVDSQAEGDDLFWFLSLARSEA